MFIDPVSTGYSRATEGEQAKPFHGFTGDLESVGEIIRLWTSRNDRWMSPKFLIGESYGGTRGAALAEYLQQRFGMFFNGVMLVAPALNMEALFDGEHSNLPHPLFLPLYAATAQYHGLLGDRTLDDVVAEARDWAETYASVLARGARVPDDERAAAVTKIASLTGLSEDYVDRANLRLEHTRVYAELLRSRRLVTGRLDTRFTGPADHYIHEQMPYDPFMSATSGPYTAALHHYLRGELEYENDAIYEVLSRQVHPWSYKEFEGQAVDVADKLGNGDDHQPAPPGAHRHGPVRRRRPGRGHRVQPRPDGDPGVLPRPHRDPGVPGGPHDVHPPGVPRGAGRGPRGLRQARLEQRPDIVRRRSDSRR